MAAATPPVPGFAQQSPLPSIGFLHSGSQASYGHILTAFRQGLAQAGFAEGTNTSIEYRWADDHFERLSGLAKELVEQRVSLIFAGGGEVSAVAAKNATQTIPIVFAIGADPVQHGIVPSLNRPGGNVTGISFMVVQVRPKLVELTRELLPHAKSVALVVNPNRLGYEQALDDVRRSADAAGFNCVVLRAGNEQEIDAAFATLAKSRVEAIIFLSDPVYVNRRDNIARLAESLRLPGIFSSREHVMAGGLLSYGASLRDAVRQAGTYAGRVLKGEKPADLPVMQPTQFELAINLKTAKAIGLPMPPTLLARADEVIE
jgi:putative ABC transport system substrate-binding protein